MSKRTKELCIGADVLSWSQEGFFFFLLKKPCTISSKCGRVFLQQNNKKSAFYQFLVLLLSCHRPVIEVLKENQNNLLEELVVLL